MAARMNWTVVWSSVAAMVIFALISWAMTRFVTKPAEEQP